MPITDQIVETFTMKTAITPREFTEQFQLRTDRRFVWFQRVIFWILRKLQCWAIRDEVAVTRIVIDPTKFMHAVFKQQQDLVNVYHYEGERLLVGAEDFSRMMQQVEPTRMFSFTASYCVDHTMFGMKVTVVPWMRGLLVLPKMD